MRAIDIEARVLQIAERVEKAQPIEDDLVEVKAEWIDPRKMSRQIAGHANAARGEPILWIVGLCEKRGVVGAGNQEMSSWLREVESHLGGLAPSIRHLHLRFRNVTLTALYIETDRAPFVWRNPAFGGTKTPIEYELPWREGTGTRSARRENVIALLTPRLRIPSIQLVDGSIDLITENPSGNPGHVRTAVHLLLKLYVAPKGKPITIPYHECTAGTDLGKPAHWHDLAGIEVRRAGDSRAIQAHLPIPAMVDFVGVRFVEQETLPFGDTADVACSMLFVGSDNPFKFRATLHRTEDRTHEPAVVAHWRIQGREWLNR